MENLDPVISDIGEIRLLDEVLLSDVAAVAGAEGDDCAHLELNGTRLLWSIDPCPTPVAAWFDKASAEVWGCYTATINLSDIAASGGQPLGMLISLEMPEDTLLSFVRGFQSGLMTALRRSNTKLLGGNIKSSKKFAATGTIIGRTGIRPVTRKISSAGCDVFLIGSIGKFWAAVIGNYYGWGHLPTLAQNELNNALCFPAAQTEAGRIIGNLSFDVACMDCSDGPANALYQLARINSLDIIAFEISRWPISDELLALFMANHVSPESACYGFGDWQLACLVPFERSDEFRRRLEGFTVTHVGCATVGAGCVFASDGRTLKSTALNQNFSGGYNSVRDVEELISRFVRQPVFD